MKIDERIIDRKYIFDCFNADEAKEFIGEDCYMTNDIELFQNLNRINIYTLDKIEDGFYNAEEDEYFDFCLPVRLLKPEEKQKQKQKQKQYRPYTFMEFTDIFTVGQPIKFRQKRAVGWERYLILNGYQHEQHEGRTITYIYIGSQGYTLDALFNDYEWQEHYTEDFEPFGVEE
jgi:hypothetical protein